MPRLGLVIGSAVAACIGPSGARADEPQICRTIRNETARRGCLEASRPDQALGTQVDPTAVRTIARPASPARPRVVSGRALAAVPNRYVGQPVELRDVGCRYLDVNRYVCITTGTPRAEVQTLVIVPPKEQVSVEAGTRDGRFHGLRYDSIRFIPAAIRRTPHGVLAETASVQVGSTAGRRRKRVISE